jgi:dTDP-glucose 4,6-dehydratase
MRVLVTGGSGFIGKHLIARLPADWIVHQTAGDISTTLRAPATDVVFSLAAQVDVAASLKDPRGTMRNNAGIAHSIVEYAQGCNAHVIHVTTAEVFGPGGPHGLWEPARPTNPYAASKAAQDAIFQVAASAGLEVSAARTANVFGEYQDPGKFVPTVIRNLQAGDPVTLYGAGKRRWIHANDVADALIRLAQQDPSTVNLTGAELLDNSRVVEMIGDRLGIRPTVNVKPPTRAGHEAVYDLTPCGPVTDDLEAGLDRVVSFWSR